MSSASPLDASETFQVFCFFQAGRDRGLQEAQVFLLWSLAMQNRHVSLVCDLYYPQKFIPGNMLKLTDNRHWMPATVLCLMGNVEFLISLTPHLTHGDTFCFILLPSHPLPLSGTRSSEDFLEFQGYISLSLNCRNNFYSSGSLSLSPHSHTD